MVCGFSVRSVNFLELSEIKKRGLGQSKKIGELWRKMKQVSRVGEKSERLLLSPSYLSVLQKNFRKPLAAQNSAEDPGTHVAVPKSHLGLACCC